MTKRKRKYRYPNTTTAFVILPHARREFFLSAILARVAAFASV